MKTFLLYIVTAVAEILGCYLPWRWLEGWRLGMAARTGRAESCCICLAVDAATGAAAGRVYAAYGGVYVAVAILWLWVGRAGQSDCRGIWAGAAFTRGVGMGIIAFQPRV